VESVCDCQALKNGVFIFTTTKIETAVIVFIATFAINYCCGDNAWIVWVCTANGDCFAFEIDISVAIACICSGIEIVNAVLRNVLAAISEPPFSIKSLFQQHS
jgi:hypothetical protein